MGGNTRLCHEHLTESLLSEISAAYLLIVPHLEITGHEGRAIVGRTVRAPAAGHPLGPGPRTTCHYV